MCNKKMKDFSVSHSKQKARKENKEAEDVENELLEIQKVLDLSDDDDTLREQKEALQEKCEAYYSSKATSAFIRSRFHYIEKGEKSTFFLFSLEKNKTKKETY